MLFPRGLPARDRLAALHAPGQYRGPRASLRSSFVVIVRANIAVTHSHHSPRSLNQRRPAPLKSVMTTLTQLRHHGGHSHGHGHSHDNTYLTSTNKKDAGVRITRIGLYVNFLMALSKGVGGFFLNSQSLMADAFHSLTDLVSDFLTLATVAWSLKPPTDRFPSGYGKIESLGALGVSSLLLAGGLGLGWHSSEILYSQLFLDTVATVAEHAHEHAHEHSQGIFGHSHSHNPTEMGIPSIHAAWIAGGSIIIKEYLYRASKFLGSTTQFQED